MEIAEFLLRLLNPLGAFVVALIALYFVIILVPRPRILSKFSAVIGAAGLAIIGLYISIVVALTAVILVDIAAKLLFN